LAGGFDLSLLAEPPPSPGGGTIAQVLIGQDTGNPDLSQQTLDAAFEVAGQAQSDIRLGAPRPGGRDPAR